MATQFSFPNWHDVDTYSKFDVAYGIQGQSTAIYYYSTRDGNLGQRPEQYCSFAATNFTTRDEITTVYFTATGSIPTFTAGSIIKVAGLAASHNYTGMAIGGGAGFVQYIDPEWPDANVLSAGTVSADLSPNWTTGFFFIPSYSVKAKTDNNAIITKLGNGYEQRMPQGVNNFSQSIDMSFEDRTNREVRAITNFVQDKAGVYPFPVLLPDPMVSNQPNLKWVAPDMDSTPVSFGRSSATVRINRVFDA